MLTNPRIATQERTCHACPEQYDGTLHDGRHFYFRYRYGVASLGLDKDPDRAVENSWLNELEVGDDGWAGVFESDIERNKAFAELLSMAEHPAGKGRANAGPAQ